MKIRREKPAAVDETAVVDASSSEDAPAEVEPEAQPDAGADLPAAAEPEVQAPEPQEDAEPAAEPAAEPVPVTDAASENGDPFASWPQAESATVIEDAPDDARIEHVRGEIDIPDGYTVIEGTPLGQRRTVAVVVSRFNGGVTNRLLARALEELDARAVAPDAITIVPVPGAFELPLAAMALAKTRKYACVVALGAVVRGETPHFDYVASEAASGLQLAGIETGIPVSFGVLTVNSVDQAEARIDRAADAVRSALEMADVFAQLRATAVPAE